MRLLIISISFLSVADNATTGATTGATTDATTGATTGATRENIL